MAEAHEFELKKLSPDGIERALKKAERYRLLNEPRDAESICRDILDTDPDNQPAAVALILCITDQFGRRMGINARSATELLDRIDDAYKRTYYHGVICERWAKAQMSTNDPGHGIYEWFRKAIRSYEEAIKLAEAGNEDAKLRYNACVRIIQRHPEIRPRPEEHSVESGFVDSAPID